MLNSKKILYTIMVFMFFYCCIDQAMENRSRDITAYFDGIEYNEKKKQYEVYKSLNTRADHTFLLEDLLPLDKFSSYVAKFVNENFMLSQHKPIKFYLKSSVSAEKLEKSVAVLFKNLFDDLDEEDKEIDLFDLEKDILTQISKQSDSKIASCQREICCNSSGLFLRESKKERSSFVVQEVDLPNPAAQIQIPPLSFLYTVLHQSIKDKKGKKIRSMEEVLNDNYLKKFLGTCKFMIGDTVDVVIDLRVIENTLKDFLNNRMRLKEGLDEALNSNHSGMSLQDYTKPFFCPLVYSAKEKKFIASKPSEFINYVVDRLSCAQWLEFKDKEELRFSIEVGPQPSLKDGYQHKLAACLNKITYSTDYSACIIIDITPLEVCIADTLIRKELNFNIQLQEVKTADITHLTKEWLGEQNFFKFFANTRFPAHTTIKIKSYFAHRDNSADFLRHLMKCLNGRYHGVGNNKHHIFIVDFVALQAEIEKNAREINKQNAKALEEEFVILPDYNKNSK